MLSDDPRSMLQARVQQGLMPSKSESMIWLGSLAPNVMVKWLSISWCLRFCSVRGFSLGCL